MSDRDSYVIEVTTTEITEAEAHRLLEELTFEACVRVNSWWRRPLMRLTRRHLGGRCGCVIGSCNTTENHEANLRRYVLDEFLGRELPNDPQKFQAGDWARASFQALQRKQREAQDGDR